MPWNARNKKNSDNPKITAGTKISHYEIIRKIGSTALGVIYLAEDSWKQRKVTLKLFFEDRTIDPEIREFMIKGAEDAATIDHPNLLAVYEIGETEGREFIVMEYAEGLNLHQMMMTGRLSVEGAIEITRQLCKGIGELHDNRIQAQLLIPEQIVITQDKLVKVINFGMIDISGTESGMIESLPPDIVSFLSPEKVNYREVDERSDIFSLGILLYTMVAHRRPFSGESGKAVAEAIKTLEPQPPKTFNPEVSDRLDRIILKMLVKNPVHRYQTVEEIAGDLANFKIPPDYDTYVAKKKDSWNWVVLIAFIILLLISFWGYIRDLILGK